MFWVMVSLPLLVVVLMLVARRGIVDEAEAARMQLLQTRNAWEQEKYLSAADVDRERERLLLAVQDAFSEGELREALSEVINEWSQVRIRAFHERRSWVRRQENSEN